MGIGSIFIGFILLAAVCLHLTREKLNWFWDPKIGKFGVWSREVICAECKKHLWWNLSVNKKDDPPSDDEP